MLEEEELVDLLYAEKLAQNGEAQTEQSAPPSSSWIESLVRAGKSTGPKEVLLRLAINRHLLRLQLSAVQIQAAFRRYSAQLRAARLRSRLRLFCRITEQIAATFLEEAVLGAALEMALHVVRIRDEVMAVRASIDVGVDLIADVLYDQTLSEMISAVVMETLEEAGDRFLMSIRASRPVEDPVAASKNPVLVILNDLATEASDSMLQDIAIDAITEEVKEYLLDSYADFVLEKLVEEESLLTLIEILRQNVYEADRHGQHVALHALVTGLQDKFRALLAKEMTESGPPSKLTNAQVRRSSLLTPLPILVRRPTGSRLSVTSLTARSPLTTSRSSRPTVYRNQTAEGIQPSMPS